MKIILKINLFLFASSSKKLIFLFILLLLLPFAGCKSVVKETVVEEPVRIVSPNGFGVLTYPYGEKSVVGEWKDGKEWNTKHTKKDGTLIGKWVNGEWKISLGVLYPRFRNGKTEWFGGTRKKSDFLKYVGEIENGLPNGQGTITTNDGYRYNGNWKDGKQHGQGTFTSLGGRVYIGDYIDDKRHGLGIETFPDGTKYVGEWKNGFIWNGKMEDKDGKILGNFVNGVYN